MTNNPGIEEGFELNRRRRDQTENLLALVSVGEDTVPDAETTPLGFPGLDGQLYRTEEERGQAAQEMIGDLSNLRPDVDLTVDVTDISDIFGGDEGSTEP